MNVELMFRAGRLKLDQGRLVPKSDPGFMRIMQVSTAIVLQSFSDKKQAQVDYLKTLPQNSKSPQHLVNGICKYTKGCYFEAGVKAGTMQSCSLLPDAYDSYETSCLRRRWMAD